MKKLILLLALTFSNILLSQDRFEKIDQYLKYLYDNNKFMGSLCIREGENVVFNKAYGFADVEQQITADRLTKYKIGSISKTFTAVMILQLIEEKKLRPETKLTRFFPKVANAENISIYDLLHQRTGIPDYVNQDSITDTEMNSADIKKALYDKIAKYDSRFSPGTKFEYSNSNYFLLGGIIEKVTQKSFAENLEDHIVKKANLINTYYKPDATNAQNKESYSYHFDGDQWQRFPEWKNDTAFASGGIISTPADLTRFISSLFEGKLIKPKSLEMMTEMKDGYGMALFQFPFGDRKFFGHNGKIENFNATMGYNPDEKLSVSLIENGSNYSLNDIMIGVLSMYYKLPFPFPNFEKLSDEMIAQYSGTYASAQIPLKLTVFGKNGELMAQGTGQSAFPLTMQSEKTFIFASAGIEIDFEDKGLILKQGGMKFNFTKE
jgi:CubicO group peptidase (beta-lactamase class C family)